MRDNWWTTNLRRAPWFKIVLAVCAIAITLTIVIPPVAKMFHET